MDEVRQETARAELIYERLRCRMDAIHHAVPAIDPPPAYWLESDASESFCRKHAIAARGREFELGPLIVEGPWYRRDDWEEAFMEGIGAYMDGCPGESDSTERCATCGQTLAYLLTDYGVEEEVAYYLDAPLTRVNGETTYALDRLACSVWGGAERARLLGVAAVINQAYRLVSHPTLPEQLPEAGIGMGEEG